MDRGAWQATVPGVTKSQTLLSSEAHTQHTRWSLRAWLVEKQTCLRVSLCFLSFFASLPASPTPTSTPKALCHSVPAFGHLFTPELNF